MITINWPDGEVQSAETAVDLLDRIRKEQWEEFDSHTFREVMAKRAYVWSGSEIFPFSTAIDFIYELANAGLFEVKIYSSVDGKRAAS